MLDNILASKLYRPGSVAYVSRSGGMSNELNNIISRTTDGVYEGVAIGGDRYINISCGCLFRHISLVLWQIPSLLLSPFTFMCVVGVSQFFFMMALQNKRDFPPHTGHMDKIQITFMWCLPLIQILFSCVLGAV